MRDSEIAKYVEAYQHSHYRMGDQRREAVFEVLRNTQRGTLIDVGAGRGETLEMAYALGFDIVAGTEVVPYLLNERVVYGEAWDLPFDSNAADVVTCFDVLEHLLHEDQYIALCELKRVARREVIVTAAEASHYQDGVEYHVGRRPYSDWERMIAQLGEFERLGSFGTSMGWRLSV